MSGPVKPRLAVVPTEPGIAARIKRLQAEAKGLARQHVEELLAAMLRVESMAIEIASGGDAYPAGIRDLAKRLAEDVEVKAQAIEAIGSRGQ